MLLTDYLQRLCRGLLPKRFYCEDALITTHNHEFVEDPAFQKAYARGVKATGGVDYHNRWRLYLALWLARTAAKLEGDFVECGVNYGFTASAIMEDLSWNNLGKTFWLIDSFSGADEGQLTEQEKNNTTLVRHSSARASGFYNSDPDHCRRNFSEWKDARVEQGWIPQCLGVVTSSKIAFLHIDLNSFAPEIAAFRYFSARLTPGAVVLLDDYGYAGGGETFREWKRVSGELRLDILSLPTGQGLIWIPPSNGRR